MKATLSERWVHRVATRSGRRAARTGVNRRGFLGGAALIGAALMVDPWGYLTRPVAAYATVCGLDSTCAAGYTVFCCTINAGKNTCPPDSFVGGWWKADQSSFCGGSARYYIDCNAYRDGRYTCHCNQTTCDQRRVACNQFRYGQCNMQIPWSNTGPVLCRVVSCTPPWVQFGGTCSSSSATDNRTATHSAPCVTGRVPVGVVDEISSSGNTVHIRGWTFDPDSPSASISVAIYEDGRGLRNVVANLPRPDVDAAKHVSGNHGFSVSFTATNGPHTFNVYALNIGSGSGNPLLGSRSLTVNPGTPPIGHLDSVSVSGDIVTLRGWAFDRDQPSAALLVAIYEDGRGLMNVRTTVDRPDVNAAFHISGIHGFSARVTARPGTHTFQVYAINVGGGVGNPLIGSRTVSVGGAAVATGRLESVKVSGNVVRLIGWARDTARPGAEVAVAVMEDGQALHWYPTGVPRPDVILRDDVEQAPGFDISLPAAPGVHTYSVHAITHGGDAIPLLGSGTVAVGQDGVIGVVDSVDVLGNTVRIRGWAYDPNRPGTCQRITVYEDGAPVSQQLTQLPFPDLPRRYGNPGFDVVLAAVPGTHNYTVYAAQSQPDVPDSMLGGATVTVDELTDWMTDRSGVEVAL